MSSHPPASIEATFACCAHATGSGHVTMVTTFAARMTIPEARAALGGLRVGLLPAVPAGWNTILADALDTELERSHPLPSGQVTT